MDQESREASSEVAQGERTPEQIQAEIDATREQLGETVAAVVEKTDVKGQAREKVAEVKQTAQAKKEDLLAKAKSSSPDSAGTGARQLKTKAQDNPLPFAIGGALLVGILLGRRGR
jgi:hypothetical protein